MTIFGYHLDELRKAVYPGLLALVAVFTNFLASGEWSQTEFALVLSGVVVVVLNFSLTNSDQFPILKLIVPPLIVNIAVLTTLLETGHLDRAALSAIAYSIAQGFLTFNLKNETPEDIEGVAREVAVDPAGAEQHPPA